MPRYQLVHADPERAAVLSKAVLGAARALGLAQAQLARVLGLSPASISRMQSGAYRLNPDAKEWELAALLVRLYRGLDAIVAGDEVALRAWMKNPNRDLDAVPAELVTAIPGLVRAVDYVDAHRARV
ncbi:XRE family transcriptional regulator [Ectothiorhodospiraceae bacterium 2226]|nr:XRE family transcriptional regulator [Ectothiorhodospiraceae bacterium 2226]